MDKIYDLVIIGAGPAGLTASLYATRSMLDAVVLEKLSPGGQVATTTEIDNYPGVPNTDGFTLSEIMKKQTQDLGGVIELTEVKSLSKDEETSLFTIEANKTYQSRTVIVATGAKPRMAGFEGEQEFTGRGVSYCGNCDAMFYRGKDVYAIGGGNTSIEEALFLANMCEHVTILVRKDHMRAQKVLQERAEANPKIDIRYNTSIVKVEGDKALGKITFKDNVTGELSYDEFPEGSKGVFVFVGHQPVIDLLGDMVEYSPAKAVITDEWMRTKTEGLFVAGDLRECPIRQIITAAADGAVACSAAAAYVGQHINN